MIEIFFEKHFRGGKQRQGRRFAAQKILFEGIAQLENSFLRYKNMIHPEVSLCSAPFQMVRERFAQLHAQADHIILGQRIFLYVPVQGYRVIPAENDYPARPFLWPAEHVIVIVDDIIVVAHGGEQVQLVDDPFKSIFKVMGDLSGIVSENGDRLPVKRLRRKTAYLYY